MNAPTSRKVALGKQPVWSSGFSRSEPPEGGTPYRWHDPDPFVAPEHGIKDVETCHEPCSCHCEVAALIAIGRTAAASRRRLRFKVPMHVEKNVGALHEPHQFQVHWLAENGGAPLHSRTLARWLQSLRKPAPSETHCALGVAPHTSWITNHASRITSHALRLLLILLYLCAWGVALADDASTALDQANKLYEEGKFTEAAAAYEKMLSQGQASSALYFNLGNAFFKAGQIGRAILNYRLAERLAPRDPDIRANLKFARNSVGTAPTSSWWQRWTSHLTLNEWTVLTSVALWLWLGLLALGQWRSALRKSLSGYTATSGIAAALLALCLGLESYNRFADKSIIVAARGAVARYGPWNESPNYFTVRDGMELGVLDSKGDWVQVADPAKRIGWVRREQVLVLPAS